MAFKTSQMDQIALEYWYYGFLGRLRVDGRGFLHQNANLEKLFAGTEIKLLHMRRSVSQSFNILQFEEVFFDLGG